MLILSFMKLSPFNVIITNQLCYKKEENLIFSDANNRCKRQTSSAMCKKFLLHFVLRFLQNIILTNYIRINRLLYLRRIYC